MKVKIGGEEYPMHFGMQSIKDIMTDMGADGDFNKAAELIDEIKLDPFKLASFSVICAFHGIAGHYRLKREYSPFDLLEEFAERVERFEEVLPAWQLFVDSFMEFFSFGDKKKVMEIR